MLVYGVIAPHPPIILPEIGGAEINRVAKTIAALKLAANKLALTKPEKIIIISPHEEHGFYVPLRYLGEKLPKNIKVEKILVTHPSYEYYYDLGKEYGKNIKKSNVRTAIIASGDLSHVLKADGPYGFNEAGLKLEKLIIDSIKSKNVQGLLKINPVLLEEGAECGLRSIIFLMSALKDTHYGVRILSHEAPFGVGYAVATLTPKGEK